MPTQEDTDDVEAEWGPSVCINFGCRINAITPEELLGKYQDSGFLYSEKMKRVGPHMSHIMENWRKALMLGERIFWVRTYDSTDCWGSLSCWRSTYSGWQAQHLVSIGGPRASRAVMLESCATEALEKRHYSYQNWFSPDNRFSARVFGSILTSIPDTCASVKEYTLLAVPVNGPRPDPTPQLRELRNGPDLLMRELADRARGQIYTRCEELDGDDILLDRLDRLYKQVGLRRYRHIWAWVDQEGKYKAAVVAFRGPLGISLSLLENRCDLLIDDRLSPDEANVAIPSLVLAARSAYVENYSLDYYPLVVKRNEKEHMATKCSAPIMKEYNQSTWTRPAIKAFYDHLDRFYAKLDRADRWRGIGAR